MIKRWISQEAGATALTYGLVVGLVAIAGIGAVTRVGTSVEGLFVDVASSIDGTATETGTDTSPTVEPVASPSTAPNTTFTFNATGSSQTLTVPDTGLYRLEVWGAQGGGGYGTQSNDSDGGAGGYARGEITLNKGEVLTIEVGTKPPDTRVAQTPVIAGGYNGGGDGWYSNASNGGGAGGGATDIRRGGTALSNRIIVGGGGGGGGNSPTPSHDGGAGGGGNQNGQLGGNNSSGQDEAGAGGTQTTGGTSGGACPLAGDLGQGADADRNVSGCSGGAGGGGYYGGGAGAYDPGGGGSGYISPTLSATNGSTGVRSGDGQAIITYLGTN